MKWTAKEWRLEIQTRVGAGDLLASWGVTFLNGRLSSALAAYPEDEQERIMAQLKLETNEVDSEGYTV